MSEPVQPSPAPSLPPDCVAIPILRRDSGAPLRLCAVVCTAPEPAGWRLISLRDWFDAAVYLGCLVDTAGQVHEWLELWVQNIEGLEASLPARRELFCNHLLDERWRRRMEAWRAANPAGLLMTGWETTHPSPSFLDLDQREAVHPDDASGGGPWELCQDDNALKAAGLPPFSTSLVRYLHQPRSTGEKKFVSVVSGAPEGPATLPMSKVIEKVGFHVPFNPQAGLMMVTEFAPFACEEYADLLGGKPWAGVSHGQRPLRLGGLHDVIAAAGSQTETEGFLFAGAQGKAGRFAEVFHLKMLLVQQLARLARHFVGQHQLPFLNLGAESFRVGLPPVSSALPFLWGARAVLAKPGDALALPLNQEGLRYFIRAGAASASIYTPEGQSVASQGLASVRLRKVLPAERNQTIVEGTMVLQERLSAAEQDLLWIRLPLPAGRLELFGHIYASEGMAQGETRFRTVPQALPDSVLAALRAAEGTSFPRSPFEVVPLLSSACDLYSLAVLAVRVLLVDSTNTLAVALDELLSLARQVASEYQAETPLSDRIRALFEKDERYVAALGPHHLTFEPLAPREASQLLPAELWFATLAALIRMLPGVGPDSQCRNLGDAPPLALETVFDRTSHDLDTLLVRSRSLLLTDWVQNREIHQLINQRLLSKR